MAEFQSLEEARAFFAGDRFATENYITLEELHKVPVEERSYVLMDAVAVESPEKVQAYHERRWQGEDLSARMALIARMHELPEPGREVMYLRVFGGLSFAEIGEVHGKSENWARVTYYRMKEKLRKEVSE